MQKIFKASLIIAVSFAVNKLLGLLRQYLIARMFGFTPEMDSFNVANNMPDLIFSLFSGGALTMAFIPVFAEYLDIKGKDESWRLFSKVVSLLFVATALASIVIAIFAPAIVSSPIGVAPGFIPTQQTLVVDLLRINLIATLIFSVSGIVMASLQAHKHFLLPAIAPIFYNLGIIIGALFLAPTFGIYGLTYGVVIGALLHLLIQIPGLYHLSGSFAFHIDLKDPGLRKILRLAVPRIITVLLIHIIFLLRDNLASRLAPGSVTALTYGYFIMQVPETLIGSSIAIALLPSLSTLISKEKYKEFGQVLTASVRVLIAASLITSVLVFATLTPLVEFVFKFSPENTHLLVWTTHAFMAGLLAQVLLEVLVRAFYARQEAKIPLYATLIRTIIFIVLGVALYKQSGAVGLAAIDSITVAIEAGFLLYMLLPLMIEKIKIIQTIWRSILGSLVVIGFVWLVFSYFQVPVLIQVSIALIVGTMIYTLFVIKEIKMLAKL